jgi:hypothetical protein
MKTKPHTQIGITENHLKRSGGQARLWFILVVSLAVLRLDAATVNIYTNDFESYGSVATNLADTVDGDPVGSDWNVVDDTGLNPNTAGAGVQVINWLSHSGSKSLLLRSSSEAQVFFPDTRSGTNYQLDFWLYVVKSPGDRNFLVILRAEGADSNGDDYVAYRSDRAATDSLFYFDGIGPVVSPSTWTDTGASLTQSQWQHHRIVINAAARTMTVYVDDMVTPILINGDLARPDSPVPSLLRIINEGNSADDGYFAIDDLNLTVDGAIDLTTTFTDGFESYPARTNEADDANPQGAWITVESDGTGNGKVLAPTKVQVVDSAVVTPHSGNKCLKLEAGQRAGASLAWGVTPQTDVQVTWWARVPAAVANNPSPDAVYLRMSLYGAEGGNTLAGDEVLLGWGIRATPLTGDATSLIYFTSVWADTTNDYTPDTWEQYQLTTHNGQGRYTIIKNPSSVNPQVIIDRAAFIGTAGTWGPTFMVAWSSSNGTNHPPVYIDDIEIKSLTSSAQLPPDPYSVTNYGTRFTNVTVLKVSGSPGKTAVDPRDNATILFTLDGQPGGIYRARKVASGNWTVDPLPVVSGIDRPSGLAISTNGTIWWTHDFTQSIQRLKAPWESNVVEEVVSYFGDSTIDDDPIDLTIAPPTFTGTLGAPGAIVVADRGSDGDPNNALNLVDPATTEVLQTNSTFLVFPSASALGGDNLNGITARAQSGEVITISTDGFIGAVNGDGTIRQILPNILWTNFFSGGPAPVATAIAADPVTGRLWISDDTLDEVWSVDGDPANQTADQREVGFLLTDSSRTDLQMDFHDPGLSFAPNGAFLVVEDTSVSNGGGRLLIFHNETISIPTFSITSAARVGQEFQLSWESAGAVKYRVQRGTNVTSFQDISADLTLTQFADTNVTGNAFYRVIATPQN